MQREKRATPYEQLNQHGRRIDAEVERLQRNRDELMLQRQESALGSVGSKDTGNFPNSRQSSKHTGEVRNRSRHTDGRRTHPSTVIEESSREPDTVTSERIWTIKQMIGELVDDSRLESHVVRDRLKNIQQKQQELFDDLNVRPLRNPTNRPVAGHDYLKVDDGTANTQQLTEQMRFLHDKVIEPTGRMTNPKMTKSDLDYSMDRTESREIDIRLDNPAVVDSIQTLNILEKRIYQEIVNLRETKIKLMKNLNTESKNYNDLLSDYKKLEQENRRLDGQYRRLDNDFRRFEDDNRKLESDNRRLEGDFRRLENESRGVKNSRDFDRVEAENAKLRDKLRKVGVLLDKMEDDVHVREFKAENVKLRNALKNAENEIYRLENQKPRQKAHRGDHQGQQVAELRQELKRKDEDLRRAKAQIAKLEEKGVRSSNAQEMLDRLKHQNDQLRKETIELLKNKGVNSRRNVESQAYRTNRIDY